MKATTLVWAALAASFTLPEMPARGAEKYAAASIPPILLPADAVFRDASSELLVKDMTQSTYTVRSAITIFSKNEQALGELILPYGNIITLDDLNGTLYDAAGREIRDLDKNDIRDCSMIDDDVLSGNWRIRSAALYHDAYPYTVEYRYTLTFNGSLLWPDWVAQSTRFPVEHASFTVITPHGYPLRSWCNRETVKPGVTDDGSTIVSAWHQELLPHLAQDEASEPPEDVTTVVKVAPLRFQLADYEGSMETWKEFGAWFHHLYSGRQTLPDDVVGEVRAVVRAAASDKAKVKALYEYMQSRTRYVGIQFGMGAWQPLEASSVHKRGYGDCKALTNYMDALLHVAGITAFPVLIKSGSARTSMVVEFPSNQFNHVILCVPLSGDTVWLECTDQSTPFGRLTDHTENRPALLVSDAGGTIVHTPMSSGQDNRQLRTVKACVSATGSMRAEITTIVSGCHQQELQRSLLHASPEERQKWYLERLQTPNVSLSAFSIEGLENRSPEITVRMTALLGRYATNSSSRLFINPNLLTKQTFTPAENRARRSPVRFGYPYVDIDSISITIPPQFTPETFPRETAISTSFGTFSCRTVASGDTAIMYVRRMELTNPTIPAEHYGEYRSFIQEIVKADRAMVVLRLKR
jgi:hypothetical protein